MRRRIELVGVLLIGCLLGLLTSLSAAGAVLDGPVGGADPIPTRSVGVTPQDARLAIDLAANVSDANPGDPIELRANVSSVGSEAATFIRLEAPLDVNATYVSSYPDATYDIPARTMRWTIPWIVVGARVNLTWTIRVVPGTPDLATITSLLRASYWNQTGASLPPEEATTTVSVQAPTFDPVLQVYPSAGERGDVVLATLYYNNTGSGTAMRAWSNWSLGGHFELLIIVPGIPTTPLVDGFGVNWSGVSPGPHALTAALKVVRGLNDGLIMGIQVHWTATDGNGNLLPESVAPGSVELLAPSISLDVSPVAQQIRNESTFVLTVTIRNVGRATAFGWLNFTLPGGITFVDDNVSLPLDQRAKRLSWTIPSLDAGTSIVLTLTLQSNLNPNTEAFAFVFAFTDGRGSSPQTLSAGASVEFVAPPASPPAPAYLLFLPWIALGALGAGGAGAFLWWRRATNVHVEDVFVAHRSGTLIAHRSTGLLPYDDEDILVAMFKVVQDFMRDAFSKGTGEEVQSFDIGERKILIERGRHHFIAVVYSGRDRGTLLARLQKVSQIIDDRFGEMIENWTGDLDDVRGIARLLPQIWKFGRRRLLSPNAADLLQIPDPSKSALASGSETGKGRTGKPGEGAELKVIGEP